VFDAFRLKVAESKPNAHFFEFVRNVDSIVKRLQISLFQYPDNFRLFYFLAERAELAGRAQNAAQ
jgi:hypothetical protein